MMHGLKPHGNGVIMTVYQLMYQHKENFPMSHFFDHETLKFFGETISSMSVLKNTVSVTDGRGDIYECYVLSAKRTKNAFGRCKPYRHYHYFDTKTLDFVITGN